MTPPAGFPRQVLTSFGQRVLVPSIYLMSTYLLPMWLMDRTRSAQIALAIGQLMVFRREAFDAVGGYRSIRRQVCEDVQMARLLKRTGHRIKFVDATQHVRCQMYASYAQAFEGVAKTYFSALDHNPVNFAFAALMLAAIAGPSSALAWALALGQPPCAVHALSVLVFLLGWLTASRQRQLSAWIVPLYPLMILSIVVNSFYAFYIQLAGRGFAWKQRYVK